MTEMTNPRNNSDGQAERATIQLVTLTIAEQLFGIPVLSVQDVLAPQPVARVPMAHPVVAGLINLRGRIVTAINMRQRMALPPRDEGVEGMSVVVEYQNELYSLNIDTIGDVVSVPIDKIEANLATLDPLWRSFADGIYRLDEQLLVILDITRLLDLDGAEAA
jgi:purine-binding chemotaxis protein CheW